MCTDENIQHQTRTREHKSMNFESRKSVFPLQNAHSSLENLNRFNNKQMLMLWFCLIRHYVNDVLRSKCRTAIWVKQQTFETEMTANV